MPPPKNGSLGRGLGDLIGGLPETIGVARTLPAEPPIPAEPQEAQQPAVNPDEPVPNPAADDTREPVMVPRHWLTLPRLVMIFVVILFALLVGFALGLRGLNSGVYPETGTPVSPIAPRVVVITNTVVVPSEKADVRPPASVDGAEFKPLEAEGVFSRALSNGMLRLIFDPPLFSSRTVLDPDRMDVLGQVGEIMARHSGQWQVIVTGHTDAIPFKNGGVFRDNQELGLARASEVIRYFWRHAKVPMTMMQATSEGDENPPFPADDDEARRKNRTVTIVIRLAP